MSKLQCRKQAHPLVEAFFKEVGSFSIKDAASKSGLDRYTIIHWRTGRVRSPKLVEFDYLLGTLGYELCFKKFDDGPHRDYGLTREDLPIVLQSLGYAVEANRKGAQELFERLNRAALAAEGSAE